MRPDQVNENAVPEWVYMAEVPPPTDEEPWAIASEPFDDLDSGAALGFVMLACAFAVGLVIGRLLP